MKVNQLTLTNHKSAKRVGRGISAGQGKTAGRGTKGQNARTGGGVRLGFEGGQNPLAKRLPKKRGFASLSRINYEVINLSSLAKLKAGSYNAASLATAGIINQPSRGVKLLGDGEVKLMLNLQIQAVSRQARTKIEQAGGTIEIVAMPRRQSKASHQKSDS